MHHGSADSKKGNHLGKDLPPGLASGGNGLEILFAPSPSIRSRSMKRRTTVVEGPLAFRMRRSAAAHNRELGLEILTLPQLAARLAGGFNHLAERAVLFNAINAALAEDGYSELESVRR